MDHSYPHANWTQVIFEVSGSAETLWELEVQLIRVPIASRVSAFVVLVIDVREGRAGIEVYHRPTLTEAILLAGDIYHTWGNAREEWASTQTAEDQTPI